MTKKEFKKLEKVCKTEWRKLVESGDDVKTTSLVKFFNYCPACDILHRVKIQLESKNCEFCPVIAWRKFSCMNKETGHYKKWYTAKSLEERKQLALQISKLKWEFLSVYGQIDISDLLED